MAETKFKVFAENTTNIFSDNDYAASIGDSTQSGRENGAQPNTIISSKLFNTVLRGNSLVVKALIDLLSDNSSLGPNSSLSDVAKEISTGLTSFVANNSSSSTIKITQTVENDSTTIKFTITSNGITENIEIKDISAKNVAGGQVGNILYKIDSGVDWLSNPNNASVLFTELDSTTSTYKPKWLTLSELKNLVGSSESADAENVTKYINGKLISTIFESNGTTVKNATNATNANTANTATNATTAGKLKNGATSYLIGVTGIVGEGGNINVSFVSKVGKYSPVFLINTQGGYALVEFYLGGPTSLTAYGHFLENPTTSVNVTISTKVITELSE